MTKKSRLVFFTDGDLRRFIAAGHNINESVEKGLVLKKPLTIDQNELLFKANELFSKHKVDEIVVTDDNNKVIGLLDIQDLV